MTSRTTILRNACEGVLYAVAACLAALIVSALLSGCAHAPLEPQREVLVVPSRPLPDYPDAGAYDPCHDGRAWEPGWLPGQRAAFCLHPDPRAP